MKIFNSFDTKLKEKEFNKAVFVYGEDKVLMIRRYLPFIVLNGVIPLFLGLIISAAFILLFFYTKSYYEPLAILFLIISGIFTLYLFKKFFYIVLNYQFDFCLVTPEELITHKQKGIFISNYKNIPVKKIKSIQSRHDGILGNIFNYGSIIILTDGGIVAAEDKEIDSSGAGIIRLTHVHRPNKTKKKILLLCIHKGGLKDIEDNKYKI